MSLLQVLYYPDKRLRKTADLVVGINNNIHCIIDNMFETMYIKEGIGLSATQVNIHQQIIVIDISRNRQQQIVLINPKLIKMSGSIGIDEGCLSIPNQSGFVSRAKNIKVRALDYFGKTFELEATDLLAICIQHEMDHLIGKLFIDYLSPLKQQRIYNKIKKIERLIHSRKKITKVIKNHNV